MLSEEMINAGAKLIDQLDECSYLVHGALWLYYPDPETWRLVIALPDVRSHGPRKAYKLVQAVVSRMPKEEPTIALQNISVVDAKDSFISMLRSAIQPGEGISGIRFSRNTINGIYVEDAYIYRLT